MESEHITNEKQPTRGLALPGWLITVLQTILTVGLPLLLVLVTARLLMSNAFLKWEYSRPYFPEDFYGFTNDDRLEYAPPALAYLFNKERVDFLSDQTFPDGTPLYNERELSHMHYVKVVTRGLVRFGFGLIVIYTLSVILLAAQPDTRSALFQALFQGSAFTVILIVAGLIVMAASFNWLFTQFHAIFFQGDSWIFPTSDTLIRLFPERFWIDAFALVFGGALVEALILGVAMRVVQKRQPTP